MASFYRPAAVLLVALALGVWMVTSGILSGEIRSSASQHVMPTEQGPPVGVCGESMERWHPDVIIQPDGTECEPGHEHGDAPPSWLADANLVIRYGGPEATPRENEMKHQAYKGFAFTDAKKQEGYLRVHAASNPHDRAARFHSYEFYLKDVAGNISQFRGWYDTGDRIKDRPTRARDTPIRPVIAVVDQESFDRGVRCEQWYMSASRDGGWGPDIGWTICNSTTLYTEGEHATADDYSTWVLSPDGSTGTVRRLEISWYGPDSSVSANRGDPPKSKLFHASQFGERVDGPDDGECGSMVSFGDQKFEVKCLPQYIATTAKAITFPGNSWQREFPGRGVKLPN